MATATKASPFTARQLALHQFMRQYQRRRGRPPSLGEIAEAFGITTSSGVFQTLDLMVEKRAVAITGKPNTQRRFVALPLPK
jgi:SOS-response transcriptional repressor LexA